MFSFFPNDAPSALFPFIFSNCEGGFLPTSTCGWERMHPKDVQLPWRWFRDMVWGWAWMCWRLMVGLTDLKGLFQPQ